MTFLTEYLQQYALLPLVFSVVIVVLILLIDTHSTYASLVLSFTLHFSRSLHVSILAPFWPCASMPSALSLLDVLTSMNTDPI
jgi:hypothetical protein